MRRSGTVHHLRITVTSWERPAPFYEPVLAALGYSLLNRDAERVCFRVDAPGGVPQLLLVGEADDDRRGTRFELGHLGLHHVAFNADSRAQVDEVYDLVRGLGAPTQGRPREYAYAPGFYAVYFRDPDNLKLEVVHVP